MLEEGGSEDVGAALTLQQQWDTPSKMLAVMAVVIQREAHASAGPIWTVAPSSLNREERGTVTDHAMELPTM